MHACGCGGMQIRKQFGHVQKCEVMVGKLQLAVLNPDRRMNKWRAVMFWRLTVLMGPIARVQRSSDSAGDWWMRFDFSNVQVLTKILIKIN